MRRYGEFKKPRVPLLGSIVALIKNFKREYFKEDYLPTAEDYISWDFVTATTGKYLDLSGVGGGVTFFGRILTDTPFLPDPLLDLLLHLGGGVLSLVAIATGAMVNSRRKKTDQYFNRMVIIDDLQKGVDSKFEQLSGGMEGYVNQKMDDFREGAKQDFEEFSQGLKQDLNVSFEEMRRLLGRDIQSAVENNDRPLEDSLEEEE